MAIKRIWVRMDGFLVGDEEIINKLVESAGESNDVDFDYEDIKDLKFESSKEGYIPWSEIENYKERG